MTTQPILGVTAYSIAERFLGTAEMQGRLSNPQILAMLKLDANWPKDDDVPWCSAFLNYVCWLLGLPRSKSLRARSWLKVGRPIPLDVADRGFDVVILSRGANAPGPEVIKAPGHVGLFSLNTLSVNNDPVVRLLGGNQGDSVSVKRYPASRVLGVRRLLP